MKRTAILLSLILISGAVWATRFDLGSLPFSVTSLDGGRATLGPPVAGGIQETWVDPDVASLIVNLTMNSGNATSRTDVTGNGRDLIFGGNAPTLLVAAYTNQYGTTLDAIEFNGTDDIASILDNAAMEIPKGIIMCWVMPLIDYDSSTPNNPGIWDKGGTFIGTGFRTDGRIRYAKFDGTAKDAFTTTTSWPSNTWFHLTVTWGATVDMDLIINGVGQGFDNDPDGWNDVTADWDFGTKAALFTNVRIASWRMYSTNELAGGNSVGVTNVMFATHPTNYVALDIHD